MGVDRKHPRLTFKSVKHIFFGSRNMKEKWKPIEGLDITAEISNKGRVRVYDVRSHGYHIEQGLKNHYKGGDGLWRIYLPVGGVATSHRIDRLVGQYHIANPNKYRHLNFKDGDKRNVWANNLEWVKNLGNHGKRWKLDDRDIADIRIEAQHKTLTAIATQRDISVSYVSRIVSGERN